MTTFSVEAGQVMYVGGTVAALKVSPANWIPAHKRCGALIIQEASLQFRLKGSIPTNTPSELLDTWGFACNCGRASQAPQRKHFFRISWRDESNSLQVAIFEVSKDVPYRLLAILQARAPQGCKP